MYIQMYKALFSGLLLAIIVLALFISSLLFGSVSIPIHEVINILLGNAAEKEAWTFIILESRLPQTITALLTGAALAVSGLLLQTAFRNPLADSGILGISAGANLGVAIIVLFFGGSLGVFGYSSLSYSLTIVFGAFVGSLTILAIIMAFATKIKNSVMLLIIGIMMGYLTSSLITILKFWSTSEDAYSFMLWGMGDFSGVTIDQLPFYAISILLGLLLSILLIKPLNALLLGDRYASNLGINIKQTRFLLLLCAGLLTAVTCAFCGPVSFIGLAVPHIARLLSGTSNHKLLIPLTMVYGAIVALLCNLISVLPGTAGTMPLNAITAIIGAPIILYIIVNQRKIQYFN